jgi:hypothetical protein
LSWAIFDDDMRDHPKWIELSPLAYRLGVRLVLWARKHSPSGYISDRVVREYAGTKTLARKLSTELVDCGRQWGKPGILERAESGFVIHDLRTGFRPEDTGMRPEPLPVRPLTKAEAGSLGGRRSVEARQAASGSARPGASKQTGPASPKQAPKHAEAATDLTCENSSEIPNPDPNSNQAVVAKDLTGSGSEAPVEAAAATAESIEERARRVVADPNLASWQEFPHTWPDLVAFAGRVHEALRLAPPKLASYHRDTAVRVLVELFAITTPEEREMLLEALPLDFWCNDKARRRNGAALLSPTVARNLIARAREDRPDPTEVGRLVALGGLRAARPPAPAAFSDVMGRLEVDGE